MFGEKLLEDLESSFRGRRISDWIGGRWGRGGGGGGRGGAPIIINIELHHGDFIFLQSREGLRASGVGSLCSNGCPPLAITRRVVHQRLPLLSHTWKIFWWYFDENILKIYQDQPRHCRYCWWWRPGWRPWTRWWSPQWWGWRSGSTRWWRESPGRPAWSERRP